MTLRSVTPLEAKRLIVQGAVLIDVREDEEYADEHIPGALLVPLSRFDDADFARHRGKILLFHCRSGARTRTHRARLAAKANGCEAFVVEGGLQAWRQQGLPTEVDGFERVERRQREVGARGVPLAGSPDRI